MFKGVRIALICIAVCATAATLQAQCPGFNKTKNTNLACELATGLRGSTNTTEFDSLRSFYVTMGGQLSQLPIASAASVSGITIGASGLPTVSTDSLGTILTQRGKTIGKHKLLLSFNFQRFGFERADGISLKDLLFVFNPFPGSGIFYQDNSRISFRVDQFTSLATFGLTDKIDVSFILPFSRVSLDTATTATQICIGCVLGVPQITALTPDPLYLPGSASGIGDVRVNVKANVLGTEGKTSLAIGGEVRFPSGDALNFLGTGAYGIKPYLVISRRGRVTPNVSIGYQWNGSSVLNFGKNLPASFLYAGGADFRVDKRLTLTAEFLGQYVINAPRLTLQTVTIPLVGDRSSVTTFNGSYAVDNASFGFKLNPFKNLILSASALVKLDQGGLRQRTVDPLFGAAYRF